MHANAGGRRSIGCSAIHRVYCNRTTLDLVLMGSGAGALALRGINWGWPRALFWTAEIGLKRFGVFIGKVPRIAVDACFVRFSKPRDELADQFFRVTAGTAFAFSKQRLESLWQRLQVFAEVKKLRRNEHRRMP